MKKRFKITLLISIFSLLLFLVAFILWKTCFDPYFGFVSNFDNSQKLSAIISQEDALKDFDYAFNKLKNKHPIWLEKTEEAENFRNLLTSKYEESKKNILEKTEFSVTELYQLVSELYAILGDGHTKVSFQTDDLLSIDNFTPLFAFGNPVAINGIDINQLYELFKSRFSFETDISIKKFFFSSYVFREDFLSLVGIDTSNNAVYTYKSKDGYEDIVHNFVPHSESFYPNQTDIEFFLNQRGYTDTEISNILNISTKEYLTPDKVLYVKIGGNRDWAWYTIDSQNDIGIFTLAKCVCDNEYISIVKDFFKEVKQSQINNVAVDLRGNGGGNSWVANEFMKHLDVESYNSWDCAIRYGPILKSYTNNYYDNQKYDTNFQGNVYILTDTKTYSAAMDFAMLIQDNNLGKIIGEPSSNKPESYGDILNFQLPNSKLVISISYKKWCRIDQSKKDLLIEPDFPCDGKESISELYKIIKK